MKIENVVVISLEDYTEYQELKNKKKEIDFSRLKTGSVVKLKLDRGSNLTAGTSCNYFKNNKYTVVLLNSNIQVSNKGVYHAKSNHFTTLVDNEGNFIHVIDFKKEHIEEVISY